MVYYSAIKKDEILIFTTVWMYLEGIVLSKISQTEKNKYCISRDESLKNALHIQVLMQDQKQQFLYISPRYKIKSLKKKKGNNRTTAIRVKRLNNCLAHHHQHHTSYTSGPQASIAGVRTGPGRKSVTCHIFWKMINRRDAWVTRLVERPTLDLSSGLDLTVVSLSSTLGSALGVEPALN